MKCKFQQDALHAPIGHFYRLTVVCINFVWSKSVFFNTLQIFCELIINETKLSWVISSYKSRESGLINCFSVQCVDPGSCDMIQKYM